MDSCVHARSVQSVRADFQDSARYSGRLVSPTLLADHLPLPDEAGNVDMAGTRPVLLLQAVERRLPARAEAVAKDMMGCSRCRWNALHRQKCRLPGYLWLVLPASNFL